MGQPLETHIRRLQEFYWSAQDPDGRGFVPLADALRKAGDFVESHRVLREGLGRHPDFISGHVVAGWLSLDRGKPGEAEDHFRTALELDPKNLAALRALSDILIERGDGGAALEVLEELSHEDPIDLSLPLRIADLRIQTGSAQEQNPDQDKEPAPPVWDDPFSAADELNWDAATLQPDESEIEGPPEGEGDESGEAEAHAEDSVPLVEDGEPIPGDGGLGGAVVTSTLGEIYLRQGLLAQAEEVFETLLKDDPESHHLLQRLDEVRSLRSGGEIAGERERPFPFEEEDLFGPETPRGARPLEQESILAGVVPIESLAPDRPSSGRSEDRFPSHSSDPAEPISIDALAPDEPISIDALAPDEPISIDALAPDEPISITALGPDDMQGDPNVGAFERWLGDLQ